MKSGSKVRKASIEWQFASELCLYPTRSGVCESHVRIAFRELLEQSDMRLQTIQYLNHQVIVNHCSVCLGFKARAFRESQIIHISDLHMATRSSRKHRQQHRLFAIFHCFLELGN